MSKIASAQTLIRDVEKKIQSWNERSMFTLKGVKNLSRADMDMLKFYAEIFIRQGDFTGYIAPCGNIGRVFIIYGVM